MLVIAESAIISSISIESLALSLQSGIFLTRC